MNARREFTKKTKGEAFLRAQGRCEACGFRLRYGEAEYDHILACREGGDNSLENCRVRCAPCHRGKSAKEQTERAKADRGFRQMANAKERHGPRLPGGKGDYRKRTFRGWVNRYTGEPL